MDRPPEKYIETLHRSRPWVAALAIIFAQYGLYTNIGGLSFFLSPQDGGPATSPVTTLCISMMGAALINYSLNGRRFVHVLLTFAALVIASLAALPIKLQAVQTLSSGVGGTMGFDTYLVIACLCLAAIARQKFFRVGAAFSIVAFLMLFNSLIGHSFGLPYFSGEMSPATMAALSFLALAAITIFIEFEPTRVLFLNTSIGDVTRLSVFVGACVPWLGGMFLHSVAGVVERAYPAEAIIVTLIILGSTLNAIRSGNVLERSDHKRREAEDMLELMAITDPLTHLLNREGIGRRLQQKREELRRTEEHGAVVLMDIDHFKQVNDMFGHDVGDIVLAHIKPMFEPYLRNGDVLARWGGEEFLIYLTVAQPTDLPAILERLRCALLTMRPTLKANGVTNPPELTASFGVAVIEPEEDTFKEAIKRADAALYKAKNQGRDRACFDESLELQDMAAARGLSLVVSDCSSG